MAGPHVRLRAGGRVDLVRPGGLVGRSISAQCRLADPRVSEAHALVTLRGRGFRLVALRGGLWVDGDPEDDVPLRPGLRVELAEDVALEVDAVYLPDLVLALEVDGGPLRELCAPVYALDPGPPVDLVPEYRAHAAAVVTSDADGWRLHADGAETELRPGFDAVVGGARLRAHALSLEQAEALATWHPGARYEPLHIVARFDSVHVFRPGRAPARLVGRPAQAISSLAEFACPVEWWRVAEDLWRDGADRGRMRRRWDRVLELLRLQLRTHGLREDLLVSDGKGVFELLLMPSDRIELGPA